MRDEEKPRQLAIVIHAFYPDIFSRLMGRFRACNTGFKLYISTSEGGGKAIRSGLRGVNFSFEIHEFENRGRDIAPFLKILPKVIGEGFEFVLKLHTKKSAHHHNGEKWRDGLYDFLVGEGGIGRNIDFLKRNPAVGIVSAPAYIFPMSANWARNGERVRKLAVRMGVDRIEPDRDVFVAGSMFMARSAALRPLAELSILPDEFEAEQDQKDGTLAHAVERAFTYSATAAGLKIAGPPNIETAMNNFRQFSRRSLKRKVLDLAGNILRQR